MKITEFTTKNGDPVPVGKFTVLVGPNNVGKSQTLKDIHQKMVIGPSASTTIVNAISLEKPATFDELLEGLEVNEDPDNIGQQVIRDIGSKLTEGDELKFRREELRAKYEESEDLDYTFGKVSRFRVAYLDAESRLSVAKAASSHTPKVRPPQNLLQALFGAGPECERELTGAFHGTFGMELRLDYSAMIRLALRVAERFPEIPEDPRKAYPILSKHRSLDGEGDGFRSFVGVVLSLLLSKGRIVLLDEPEAFLHPAQARQLGHWIAEHAERTPSQIIVATHNANFLAGILASTQPANVYRLNRAGDTTHYVRISPEATSQLAKSPVLSSQRVLDAIFHEGVVVCEGDADRVLYQTVAGLEHETRDIFFIHAHNKQTISKVVSLLTASRIPVCAVADIDILDSETELTRCVEALRDGSCPAEILRLRGEVAKAIQAEPDETILAGLTTEVEHFLEQLREEKHGLPGARGALNRLRRGAGKWSGVKTEGIDGIPEPVQEQATEILTLAKEAGLFIVPVGELESWMSLGTTRKSRWIVLALEALHRGECPEPLKEFVREVLQHLENAAPQEPHSDLVRDE